MDKHPKLSSSVPIFTFVLLSNQNYMHECTLRYLKINFSFINNNDLLGCKCQRSNCGWAYLAAAVPRGKGETFCSQRKSQQASGTEGNVLKALGIQLKFSLSSHHCTAIHYLHFKRQTCTSTCRATLHIDTKLKFHCKTI